MMVTYDKHGLLGDRAWLVERMYLYCHHYVCFAIVSNITISWIFNDCQNPWASLSYDFFHIFIIFALT